MLGLYSLNGTAIVKVKNLKEKYGYIVQKGLWNVNKLIHIEPENKNITWLINIIYFTVIMKQRSIWSQMFRLIGISIFKGSTERKVVLFALILMWLRISITTYINSFDNDMVTLLFVFMLYRGTNKNKPLLIRERSFPNWDLRICISLR